MKFSKSSKKYTELSPKDLKKKIAHYLDVNLYKLNKRGYIAKIHDKYIDQGIFLCTKNLVDVKAAFWARNKNRVDCFGQYKHLRIYRQPFDDVYVNTRDSTTKTYNQIKKEVIIKYFHDQLILWCDYWMQQGVTDFCTVRELGKPERSVSLLKAKSVYKNMHHVFPEFIIG